MAGSKRKETAFIRYLWDDAEVDSAGSVRSWEKRYDGGDRDWMRLCGGAPVLLEHKWRKWPAGSRAMMSILENAYKQLTEAYLDEWDDAQPSQVPFLLVGYTPLGTGVENAICYFDFHGQMVMMLAEKFKKSFIEGETDEHTST